PAVAPQWPDRATAPEHHAVPDRRPLIGIKLRTDIRMDSVSADEQVARKLGAAAPVRNLDCDAAIRLSERLHRASRSNGTGTQLLDHGLVDEAEEPSAMDTDLGMVVACFDAAQLLPDDLPEAVGIEKLACPDASRFERWLQSQAGEFLDRMRQHVDADTEFTDLARPFEHLDLYTDPLQE